MRFKHTKWIENEPRTCIQKTSSPHSPQWYCYTFSVITFNSSIFHDVEVSYVASSIHLIFIRSPINTPCIGTSPPYLMATILPVNFRLCFAFALHFCFCASVPLYYPTCFCFLWRYHPLLCLLCASAYRRNLYINNVGVETIWVSSSTLTSILKYVAGNLKEKFVEAFH